MPFIFGLVLIGFGIYLLYRSFRLKTKGLATIGKIFRVQYGFRGHFTIFVRFNGKKGRKVEFKTGSSSFASIFYHVGDSVAVLYNPQNPKDAIIATWDMMWLPSVLITLLGVFIFSLVFK